MEGGARLFSEHNHPCHPSHPWAQSLRIADDPQMEGERPREPLLSSESEPIPARGTLALQVVSPVARDR